MYFCEETEFDSYSKQNNFKKIKDRIIELFGYNKIECPDITIDSINIFIQCLNVWYYKYKMTELLNAKIFCDLYSPVYEITWLFLNKNITISIIINIHTWYLKYVVCKYCSDNYELIKLKEFNKINVREWVSLCGMIKNDINSIKGVGLCTNLNKQHS